MLSSVPQPDGTCIITIDFPYYLNPSKRKYFQTRSFDEAKAAAEHHAAWCKKLPKESIEIRHFPEKQSFHVVSIERRHRQQAVAGSSS